MYSLSLLLPLLNAIICLTSGCNLGSSGVILITQILHASSCLVSVFILYEVVFCHSVCVLEVFPWFNVYNLHLNWSFIFDPLTAFMLLIITFIAFCVQLYSFEYMSHDPFFSKFIAYLSFFTFSMLLLVTADNVIQLFLGWEAIGLCSFILISFWFTRANASKSAIKAVIVNRFGDFGIFIAMVLMFTYAHTLTFNSLRLNILSLLDQYIYLFNFKLDVLTLICFFLILGVVGKSAQFVLHTWLPDAMEGPTPVSALLHAATMVTAGVFVVLRFSFLLEYSQWALLSIAYIGISTAFLSASIGLFQNDLKKVIAYSTCSQLGYMLFICGLSNYSLGFFHLVNHAFFKALLFLSAGIIIHALNDEQDMRRMGGSLNLLPFCYLMFLIGSLALMGIPFLSGFFSKDKILEGALSFGTFHGSVLFFFGILVALITALYSFRLISMVFIYATNSDRHAMLSSGESGYYMTIPLFTLVIFAIFFGYLFSDLFIGLGGNSWGSSIIVFSHHSDLSEEYLFYFYKLIPFFSSLIGIFLSFMLFKHYEFLLTQCFYVISSIYFNIVTLNKFFINKWFFDEIYGFFVSRNLLKLSFDGIFFYLDRGLLEFIGPYGIVHLFGIYFFGKLSILYILFNNLLLSQILFYTTTIVSWFFMVLLTIQTYNELIFNII